MIDALLDSLHSVTALLREPTILLVACSVLGLVVGSFLNVVILRYPKMLDAQWRRDCAEFLNQPIPDIPSIGLATPPSACPHCGFRLKPWHNIPVISYLWLRGKCANCQNTISPRYPLIELLSSLLAGYAAWHMGFDVKLVGALLLIWTLIALTFIDADTQLLPDNMTLPLLWLGLFFNLWHVYVPLQDALIGAMAGYVSLWSVYWLFKFLTGKEGMGFGDFKLLAALGAWLGWQMLPQIILLSSALGAVLGILFILSGKTRREHPLPFGPYLAFAGLIALFFGTSLNTLYLNII